jgi:hypothetical protein
MFRFLEVTVSIVVGALAVAVCNVVGALEVAVSNVVGALAIEIVFHSFTQSFISNSNSKMYFVIH